MVNDRTGEYGYMGLMSDSTWPRGRPSDTTGSPPKYLGDAAIEVLREGGHHVGKQGGQ